MCCTLDTFSTKSFLMFIIFTHASKNSRRRAREGKIQAAEEEEGEKELLLPTPDCLLPAQNSLLPGENSHLPAQNKLLPGPNSTLARRNKFLVAKAIACKLYI